MRGEHLLNFVAPPAWSSRAARTTLVALCGTIMFTLIFVNLAHLSFGGSVTWLTAMDSDEVSWGHLVVASTLLCITGFAISQAPEVLVERLVLPVSSFITLSTVVIGHYTGEFGLAPHVLLYMPLIACAYTLRPRYVVQATTVTLFAAAILAALNAQSYKDWSDDAVSFAVSATYLAFTLSFIRAKQQQAADQAMFFATHDPLTRVLNRRQFEQLAPMRLGSSAQTPGCLLVVDLDHFNLLNDTHGHIVGDAVLEAVGSVMTELVTPQGAAYRLGGDEFAVSLTGASLEDAEVVATKLVTSIGSIRIPTKDDGEMARVTCSVGIAHWPTHADDHPNLYAAADAALYRAKEQGRGCFAAPAVTGPPKWMHSHGLTLHP